MTIKERLESIEERLAAIEETMAMDEVDLDWVFEEVCRLKDGPAVEELDELVELTNCDIFTNCEECPEFDQCFFEIAEEEGVCPADCDEDCECCGCDEEDCDECEVYLRDQERQCSPECEEDCTTCYWEEGAAFDEMEAYLDALRFKGL